MADDPARSPAPQNALEWLTKNWPPLLALVTTLLWAGRFIGHGDDESKRIADIEANQRAMADRLWEIRANCVQQPSGFRLPPPIVDPTEGAPKR